MGKLLVEDSWQNVPFGISGKLVAESSAADSLILDSRRSYRVRHRAPNHSNTTTEVRGTLICYFISLHQAIHCDSALKVDHVACPLLLWYYVAELVEEFLKWTDF